MTSMPMDMNPEIARKLKEIGDAFCIQGPFFSYEEIKMGNVNHTYKVNYIVDDGTGMAKIKSYLVQRVNTYAFQHPVELMQNIDRVTEHIRRERPKNQSLHFHHTEDRKNYLMDDDGFWRLSNYVPSVTYDSCDDLDVVRSAGEAFGDFQMMLSDFDAEQLYYLDPDMLIINPLRPLWELNLYGKTFAAAAHTGLTEMANGINQVRLDTEHEYFNSGVMLIDLNAARKLVTAENVFASVKENERNLILPDQDVFNMLYGKQTMPIDDVIWNYDVRNYAKYLIRSTGKHDLNWVMQNTAVLHFCGKNKPWHEDYKNPFGMLYLHYRNLTMRKQYGAVLVCRTQVPRA